MEYDDMHMEEPTEEIYDPNQPIDDELLLMDHEHNIHDHTDEIMDYIFDDSPSKNYTNILDLDDPFNMSSDKLLDIDIPGVHGKSTQIQHDPISLSPQLDHDYEENYDHYSDELVIIDKPPSPSSNLPPMKVGNMSRRQQSTQVVLAESSTGTKRYQSELTKPVIQTTNLAIGYGNARLFGLIDSNGQLKLPSITQQSKSLMNKKSFISRLNHITNTKQQQQQSESNQPPDEDLTFQPKKSNEAMKAMKNPRCGYDFLTRLNEETIDKVLERLTTKSGKKGGLSKSALEALENDYMARQDKLSCPSCKKYQSFMEYYEKRRHCTQCNVKYTKLNITTGESFMKMNEIHSQKKLQKLKVIEDEMYGNLGKPVMKTLNYQLPRTIKTRERRDDVEGEGEGNENEVEVTQTDTDQEGNDTNQKKFIKRRPISATAAVVSSSSSSNNEDKKPTRPISAASHGGKLETFITANKPLPSQQPNDRDIKISKASMKTPSNISSNKIEKVPVPVEGNENDPSLLQDGSSKYKKQSTLTVTTTAVETSNNGSSKVKVDSRKSRKSKTLSNITNYSSSEDETAQKFKKLIL